MADNEQQPADRQIGIQKIYVKDFSFESPKTPQVFGQSDWNPKTDLNLRSSHTSIADDHHEIVLTITIEAKEGVDIRPENVTLASVTFQNYFRLYDKLAGMTGTAATEAEEFQQIYGLGVVEIPTNMPVVRKDWDDMVYRTEEGKFTAVVDEIVALAGG